METRKLVINHLEFGTIGMADRFLLRLRGMIGRDFSRFDALLIRPCSEIHTLFMAYPIDVLFVDQTGRIVKIAENLRPWVPYKGARRARAVVELPAGEACKWLIRVGDTISIE